MFKDIFYILYLLKGSIQSFVKVCVVAVHAAVDAVFYILENFNVHQFHRRHGRAYICKQIFNVFAFLVINYIGAPTDCAFWLSKHFADKR